MILANAAALQVVLPLIAAPLVGLINVRPLGWIITTLVAIACTVLSLHLAGEVFTGASISYAMGGWEPPIGIEYRVDRLNAPFLVLLSLTALIVMPYAYKAVRQEIDDEKQPLFYAMFLLCLTGLMGIVITNDLFNIFVFLEISSLATYTLIACGKHRKSLMAAFEYLVLGTLGATFILIGIGFLYMMTGTLNITDLATRLGEIEHTLTVKAGFAFLTLGIGLKIALFPLHIWLTNAYTHAPNVVSTFLAATATKVGLYLLMRISFTLFGISFAFEALPLDIILMVLASLAIIIGSLSAIFSQGVKRMLAFSSIAQIGYIVLGISLYSVLGLTAAIAHIFNHALAKAGLFMAAGCVGHKKGGTSIEHFAGIARDMPVTFACFVIAGLSLIGVPLTAGFISKWTLLQALMADEIWLLIPVLLISSLLAVLYIWKVVQAAYFAPNTRGKTQRQEAPLMMLIPLVMLAAANIYFGIFTEYTLGMAESAATAVIAIGRAL